MGGHAAAAAFAVTRLRNSACDAKLRRASRAAQHSDCGLADTLLVHDLRLLPAVQQRRALH
jgi:hypothetical protein